MPITAARCNAIVERSTSANTGVITRAAYHKPETAAIRAKEKHTYFVCSKHRLCCFFTIRRIGSRGLSACVSSPLIAAANYYYPGRDETDRVQGGAIIHHSSLTPSSALVYSLVDNFNVGLLQTAKKGLCIHRRCQPAESARADIQAALAVASSCLRMLTRPSPAANTHF